MPDSPAAQPWSPAEISPRAFFRFAADHSDLLTDLFYRSAGITEAELEELVLRRRRDHDPAPHRVVAQLERLGFMEPAPGGTATYEMTRPVAGLLAYLLRCHRLTSVEVIQAYLADLDRLAAELDAGLEQPGADRLLVRVLDEVAELIERIRQDSRSNRDGIIGEVIRCKTNRERMSVRERFAIVNRLWQRYLEPLRDLIDVRKAMDTALDRMAALLGAGSRRFAADRIMAREFEAAAARLLRLRREVRRDYHESLAELGPLYEALRRDSGLARGAGLALEIIGRKGVRALDLTGLLALPVWRTEGLLADSGLLAFLHGIRGYEPQAAPALAPPPANAAVAPVIPAGELRAALAGAVPVDDLLAWLVARFPGQPPAHLLQAYGRVLGLPGFRFETAAREASYELGPFLIRAHPKRVDVS